MSFDEYANHIYQKHRLAVALGILKSKPPNITTTNYLEQLKSIVDHKMDDDDVTVCSDDFIMDDDDTNDSVTILKDFDLSIGHEVGLEDLGDVRNDERPASEKLTIPIDSTQTTYFDSSQTKFTPNIDNITTDITIYEDNHNLNQNFNIDQSTSRNIVSIDEEFNDKGNFNDNVSNKTKSHTNDKESNNETIDSNNKSVDDVPSTQNMDLTYYDSQKTILYTVHGFTQNNTHYSPSQNEIIIPSKYIQGINYNRTECTVQNNDTNEENNIDTNSEIVYSKNIDELTNKTQIDSTENNLESKINEKPSNYHQFLYSETMNVFSRNNDESFDQIKDDLLNQSNNFNNDIDKTNNNTNINNNDENEIPKPMTSICNFTQNAQNMDEYFEEMQKVEDNDARIVNNCVNTHSEFNDMGIINETVEYNRNTGSNEFENRKTDEIETNNLKFTQNSRNQIGIIANLTDFPNDNDEEIVGENDSQEIISYKVLSEFNKVKTYLNTPGRRMSCDGYSTDSGYRSDTQIRSSNRSALQLSGNWLNQSGCCLYNYIIQCPLVAGTRDITNEIAQVLNQLVDRLHEEENYPSFLEDILETVDVLLRQVYEGVSSGDSEFLKKDENIQRILLLNKSVHIQKHSIEKISNILETFHSKITETDATYELSNIDKVENISYIFHVLEILLKKYLKNRDMLSQSSTQMSQDEDKIFKKSSITDIWRKKWNPSQKVFEGSREKKCVLKACSDVLNKIVVDCVNSYSLVAYSALKCFNSMQS